MLRNCGAKWGGSIKRPTQALDMAVTDYLYSALEGRPSFTDRAGFGELGVGRRGLRVCSSSYAEAPVATFDR